MLADITVALLNHSFVELGIFLRVLVTVAAVDEILITLIHGVKIVYARVLPVGGLERVERRCSLEHGRRPVGMLRAGDLSSEEGVPAL